MHRTHLRGHGLNFLFQNPQLQHMKTKLQIRKDCPTQLVLREVLKLKAYCSRTTMGGSDKVEPRVDHPNGKGFSAKFRSYYKLIEAVHNKTPSTVQHSVRKDVLLMQTLRNGCQFESKTRSLYMTPLQGLENTLRRYGCIMQ